MKKVFLLLVLATSILSGRSQTIITIPYDATAIPNQYRDANPDYLIYPASLDGVDSIEMDCLYDIETIDLGLSVKWANCNVGAKTLEHEGYHFAWGEVETKSGYTWKEYLYYNGTDESLNKYHKGDGLLTLDPADDVAATSWAESWRMPTKEEFQELRDKCKWEWKTINNRMVYEVTGPNGRSIIIPAAGIMEGTLHKSHGTYGYYWSSTLNQDNVEQAWILFFKSNDKLTNDGVSVDSKDRYLGMSIRPVCP